MADRYGKILISPPGGHGRLTEGIIDGAYLPGTCLTVKAGVAPVNGRFTYEAWNRAADGNMAMTYVLLEDYLQGKGVASAYIAGKRGFLYCPQAGDILQLIVASGVTPAIETYYVIDDGTGKLIIGAGTEESEPFVGREAASALGADTLMLVECTGK